MFPMTPQKKTKTKSEEASHIKIYRKQGNNICFKLQRKNLSINFVKDIMFAVPSRVGIFMKNIGNLQLLYLFFVSKTFLFLIVRGFSIKHGCFQYPFYDYSIFPLLFTRFFSKPSTFYLLQDIIFSIFLS